MLLRNDGYVELLAMIGKQAVIDDIMLINRKLEKELVELGIGKKRINEILKEEKENIKQLARVSVYEQMKEYPEVKYAEAERNRNKIAKSIARKHVISCHIDSVV